MTIVRSSSRLSVVRLGLVAALLAGGTLSLGGCSSSSKKAAMSANAPAAIDGQMTSLEGLDNSMAYEHMSLVRGQKFSVRLPTYSGSNYGWRLAPESADSKFVSLLERRSQQTGCGMPGSSGSESFDVFTFRANRTGECEIQFIYDRPFMPEEKARREFAMGVDISKVTKESKPQLAQVASVTVE